MIKRWFTIGVFIVMAGVIAQGQTTDCPATMPAGTVCITQEAANRTAAAIAELIEARKSIAEFLKERALTDIERTSAARLQAALNAVITTGEKISSMKDQMIELQQKTILLQNNLILKMEAEILKPKSGWQKFLDYVKIATSIVFGIYVGRRL